MVMTPKEKKAFVARMKKGRKAAKKSGGKTVKQVGKTNLKKLQKRIEDLEQKLGAKFSESEKSGLTRQLEAGDW